MKKLLMSFLLFGFFTGTIYSQEPKGYYNDAEGKQTESLKTALHNVIKGHNSLSYKALWSAFKYTDKRSDGKVWDIYSNITDYTFGGNQCGSYSGEGACYNREHSFPKSWFGKASPMNSDLFHLYPSDGYVNGQRSNFPFGEVGSTSYTSHGGFSKKGTCSFPGYSGTVFEPNDQYKGDLARTYFYMVTRYEDKVSGWNSNQLAGNKYPALNSWSVKLFLKWHRQDPVSQKEIDRNNVIYSKYQHNRNPFIDHPELVEYIWGTKKGEAWSKNGSTAAITSPQNNTKLDFGTITIGQQIIKTINIKASGLTGDLTLQMSGANASDFILSQSVVSQSDAIGGKTVNITFVSASVGNKQANLAISGEGVTTVNVSLVAEISDGFVATNATQVTDKSFVANWTKYENAIDYQIDVYTKDGTATTATLLLEEDFNQGLPATWSRTGYIDSNTDSNIRLGSGKKDGEISTVVDLSTPSTITIKAKRYNNDTDAKLYVSVDGNEVATIITTSDYETTTIDVNPQITRSKISLKATKKKRVFLDEIKVESQQATQTKTSLQGYPKNVGNILEYRIEGLDAEVAYFYTVMPVGNPTVMSSEISVVTLAKGASVDEIDMFNGIMFSYTGNRLIVTGIPNDTKVELFDISGKTLFSKKAEQYLIIPFAQKGVYILKLEKENRTTLKKIMF